MLSTNNDSLLTVAVTTIMPKQQYHNHAAISTEAEADAKAEVGVGVGVGVEVEAEAEAEAHATILPQTPAESSLFELKTHCNLTI